MEKNANGEVGRSSLLNTIKEIKKEACGFKKYDLAGERYELILSKKDALKEEDPNEFRKTIANAYNGIDDIMRFKLQYGEEREKVALKYFLKTSEPFPNDCAALFDAGEHYIEFNDLTKAKEQFEKAIIACTSSESKMIYDIIDSINGYLGLKDYALIINDG